MLLLKKGIKITGAKAELLLGIMVVHSIYENFGIDCIITEITGGKHSAKSHHYKGLAVDFRTKNVPRDILDSLYDTIKSSLDEWYDIVLEDRNGNNEHFHLEYDPVG